MKITYYQTSNNTYGMELECENESDNKAMRALVGQEKLPNGTYTTNGHLATGYSKITQDNYDERKKLWASVSVTLPATFNDFLKQVEAAQLASRTGPAEGSMQYAQINAFVKHELQLDTSQSDVVEYALLEKVQALGKLTSPTLWCRTDPDTAGDKTLSPSDPQTSVIIFGSEDNSDENNVAQIKSLFSNYTGGYYDPPSLITSCAIPNDEIYRAIESSSLVRATRYVNSGTLSTLSSDELEALKEHVKSYQVNERDAPLTDLIHRLISKISQVIEERSDEIKKSPEDTHPMNTSIEIPNQARDKIIGKSMRHQGITNVDGQITEKEGSDETKKFPGDTHEFSRVHIEAVDYVDFKEIDPRIKTSGFWRETHPMSTSIEIPNQARDEIIGKLMQHQGITSIDGQSTKVQIEIGAVADVDFKKIDPRIQASGLWRETYPGSTSITIPHQARDEIIGKLMQHQDITSVDGQSTEKGEEIQASMRNQFK